MPAADALERLKFVPQKAARLISKVIKSAIANAENNNNLDPASLTIKQALIGEGITIKRYSPRARGSASAIRKRTSHIKIILTDQHNTAEKQKTTRKKIQKTPKQSATKSSPKTTD